MDIYARRHLRLQEITAARYPGRGGMTRLAAQVDRQVSYLSRCLSGKKRIGDAFARHLEACLGLPMFWLDGIVDASVTL